MASATHGNKRSANTHTDVPAARDVNSSVSEELYRVLQSVIEKTWRRAPINTNKFRVCINLTNLIFTTHDITHSCFNSDWDR